MEPMIILRGYGEPQKLLAKSLLLRSPKRKSLWIFQNVINSVFQRRKKEPVAGLAAEEPGCTRRAAACPAATAPLGAKDTVSTRRDRSPLPRRAPGRALSALSCSLHTTNLAVRSSMAPSLMGMFTGSRAQAGV